MVSFAGAWNELSLFRKFNLKQRVIENEVCTAWMYCLNALLTDLPNEPTALLYDLESRYFVFVLRDHLQQPWRFSENPPFLPHLLNIRLLFSFHGASRR